MNTRLKDFKFSKEKICSLWASGKVVMILGKEYTVHKMSYGDYFLEPISWKGGENDGFSTGTLWLEIDTENEGYYQFNELLNSK